MKMATRHRTRESGQTIILIAVSLAAFLAMAMLAIDVVTLYNARSEAQRVADAAALAGAKAFVTTGFTSSQLGDPTSNEGAVCSPVGGTGFATQAAVATASQNPIAGAAATLTSVTCNPGPGANWENPQITVTAQSSSLPILFSRIFSHNAITASATATAEAFNPSGTTTPVSVTNVKPWAIPNCAPGTAIPLPPCPNNPYFVDTAAYSLLNPTNYIGRSFPFYLNDGNAVSAPPPIQYWELVPPLPTMCPADSQVGCNGVSGGDNYMQNIACTNVSTPVTCGEMIGFGQTITALGTPDDSSLKIGGQCLIHASALGAGMGQDVVSPAVSGTPINISGGTNNPDINLQGKASINRSDSVVSVPIYDGSIALCSKSGFNIVCLQSAAVIGFLQLAVQDIQTDGNGHAYFDAVIMNAVGCNPTPTNPVVTGGTVSPIPVRLIGQ